jgi:hypothetical protein
MLHSDSRYPGWVQGWGRPRLRGALGQLRSARQGIRQRQFPPLIAIQSNGRNFCPFVNASRNEILTASTEGDLDPGGQVEF